MSGGRNCTSHANNYTVRHYGHKYSIISEKSNVVHSRFYATIESRYGGNHFTVVIVGKRNGNFFMVPTVYGNFPLTGTR